jgi:hypothetical protein
VVAWLISLIFISMELWRIELQSYALHFGFKA